MEKGEIIDKALDDVSKDTIPSFYLRNSINVLNHPNSLSLEGENVRVLKFGRSNSHFPFYYNPEFVPKPRPKYIDINPSPMKLCIKSYKEFKRNKTSIVQETNNYYISCPESDNSENESDCSTVETIDNTINNCRKEMNKIRISSVLNPSRQNSKEFDNYINRKKEFYRKKILGSTRSKKKKNSKFKKIIKNYFEDGRFSGVESKNKESFSILGILECNAELQTGVRKGRSTVI